MQECKPDVPREDAGTLEENETAGSSPAVQERQKRRAPYWAGAAWALLTISIWSGWFISSRFDVSGGLTAYDLVALRFGVAGVVLLPVSIRLRGGLGLLRWPTALVLFAGSGVTYSLATAGGLTFAPAAEAAALTPGAMPIATAVLSLLFLKERVTRSQFLGFCLISCGIFAIASLGLFEGAHLVWIGHILFLTGAFLFASYTVALKRSGLSGMEAVSLVSLWSSLLYLPVYVLALHPRVLSIPAHSLLVPAFYQAILANIVSLIAYGRAVTILGASRAASFAALIPALTALLGMLLLHEYPTALDWAGIVCVSAGVYLASGAPLRWTVKRFT